MPLSLAAASCIRNAWGGVSKRPRCVFPRIDVQPFLAIPGLFSSVGAPMRLRPPPRATLFGDSGAFSSAGAPMRLRPLPVQPFSAISVKKVRAYYISGGDPARLRASGIRREAVSWGYVCRCTKRTSWEGVQLPRKCSKLEQIGQFFPKRVARRCAETRTGDDVAKTEGAGAWDGGCTPVRGDAYRGRCCQDRGCGRMGRGLHAGARRYVPGVPCKPTQTLRI